MKTKKELRKYFIFPVLIQLGILAVAIITFVLFIGERNGLPLLQEQRNVCGEETNPNLVRLLFMITVFVLSFVLAFAASKKAASGTEKDDLAAFWLGIVAGIMLWQAIGECAWHFELFLRIGGEQIPVPFPRLESAASWPLILPFTLLLIYGEKHHCFDFGIRVFLLSFYCNWAGHFLMLGTHPFVSTLLEERLWFAISGSVAGVIVIIASLLHLKKVTDRRALLVTSLALYAGIGSILTGVMDG